MDTVGIKAGVKPPDKSPTKEGLTSPDDKNKKTAKEGLLSRDDFQGDERHLVLFV